MDVETETKNVPYSELEFMEMGPGGKCVLCGHKESITVLVRPKAAFPVQICGGCISALKSCLPRAAKAEGQPDATTLAD